MTTSLNGVSGQEATHSVIAIPQNPPQRDNIDTYTNASCDPSSQSCPLVNATFWAASALGLAAAAVATGDDYTEELETAAKAQALENSDRLLEARSLYIGLAVRTHFGDEAAKLRARNYWENGLLIGDRLLTFANQSLDPDFPRLTALDGIRALSGPLAADAITADTEVATILEKTILHHELSQATARLKLAELMSSLGNNRYAASLARAAYNEAITWADRFEEVAPISPWETNVPSVEDENIKDSLVVAREASYLEAQSWAKVGDYDEAIAAAKKAARASGVEIQDFERFTVLASGGLETMRFNLIMAEVATALKNADALRSHIDAVTGGTNKKLSGMPRRVSTALELGAWVLEREAEYENLRGNTSESVKRSLDAIQAMRSAAIAAEADNHDMERFGRLMERTQTSLHRIFEKIDTLQLDPKDISELKTGAFRELAHNEERLKQYERAGDAYERAATICMESEQHSKAAQFLGEADDAYGRALKMKTDSGTFIPDEIALIAKIRATNRTLLALKPEQQFLCDMSLRALETAILVDLDSRAVWLRPPPPATARDAGLEFLALRAKASFASFREFVQVAATKLEIPPERIHEMLATRSGEKYPQLVTLIGADRDARLIFDLVEASARWNRPEGKGVARGRKASRSVIEGK